MKHLAQALVLITLIGVIIWMVTGTTTTSRSSSAQDEPAITNSRAPLVIEQTVSLLPGQTYDLTNRQFRKIELHSQYAIQVVNGSCRERFAVEVHCDNPEPFDVVMVDTRSKPLFTPPTANVVSVKATEF